MIVEIASLLWPKPASANEPLTWPEQKRVEKTLNAYMILQGQAMTTANIPTITQTEEDRARASELLRSSLICNFRFVGISLGLSLPTYSRFECGDFDFQCAHSYGDSVFAESTTVWAKPKGADQGAFVCLFGGADETKEPARAWSALRDAAEVLETQYRSYSRVLDERLQALAEGRAQTLR